VREDSHLTSRPGPNWPGWPGGTTSGDLRLFGGVQKSVP
jgi:hypothetical protein